MKKRIVVFAVILCLLSGFAVRFYYVNRHVELPIVQEFLQGEIVPFGNDFSDAAGDSAPGYTLQVLDSVLFTISEFLDQYDSEHEMVADGFTQYFYLVKISVGNIDNTQGEESGVSLPLIPLVGTNYFMMIDYPAFKVLNPNMPGLDFSLQPGTTKEFLLPYAINSDVHTSYRRLQKDILKLQLTEYPHRKRIALN
ncbi:DUF5028 domain-containing protein [Lachnospiraceae bacterium ZAX-1]